MPDSALMNEEVNSEKFISSSGVNLLSIKATDVCKYALAIMDALFTQEELAAHCHKSSGTKSSSSSSTKPPLSPEECIVQKFGRASFLQNEDAINHFTAEADALQLWSQTG